MPTWNDPTIMFPALISAVSGLLGAAIGGWCTLRATKTQLKKQEDERINEWRLRLGRQVTTIRVMIDKAQFPHQFTEAALMARRFFFENPESLLLEPGHQTFFDEHLAVLSATHPPSELYWDSTRKEEIKAAATRLLHS